MVAGVAAQPPITLLCVPFERGRKYSRLPSSVNLRPGFFSPVSPPAASRLGLQGARSIAPSKGLSTHCHNQFSEAAEAARRCSASAAGLPCARPWAGPGEGRKPSTPEGSFAVVPALLGAIDEARRRQFKVLEPRSPGRRPGSSSVRAAPKGGSAHRLELHSRKAPRAHLQHMIGTGTQHQRPIAHPLPIDPYGPFPDLARGLGSARR